MNKLTSLNQPKIKRPQMANTCMQGVT